MTLESISHQPDAAVGAGRPLSSLSTGAAVAGAPVASGDGGGENGEYVDWLTKELGRRPSWAERAERARMAAKELGIPPPPERAPLPALTPEEHAARVAQTKRIRDAIREEAKGWQFDSTRFIRDMRDGKVDDAPDAYWRPPASAHAGA